MMEEMVENCVKTMIPGIAMITMYHIEENFTESVELLLVGLVNTMMEFG